MKITLCWKRYHAAQRMVQDLSQAKYEIETFLAANESWKCWREGVFIAELSGANISVTLEFGKLILSVWGEDFSESWKIEEYEIARGRLKLHLSRQLGRLRTLLEFRSHAEDWQLSEDVHERRREFERVICELIQRKIDARIERAITERDDFRQLSGVYTRLILEKAGERVIAIAVNPYEAQAEIDGLLTAGLIWLDRANRLRSEKPARRLLLLAPWGKAENIARRMTALGQQEKFTIELHEVNARSGEVVAVRPFDQGGLFDPAKHRLPEAAPELRPNPLRDHLLRFAPEKIRIYRRPGSSIESLRIWGLEVARISAGRVLFGVGSEKRRLQDNWREVESLINEVARIRQPESEEKFHQFYRLQTERWLEEIIREDVRRLDARLDPRFIYPQIPTHRDDDYGMVDLLGITDAGQLAIIELKVAEDRELPMQGIDYWLKIEWHRQRGDFHRRGYFPGVEIADRPALLLLVSPLLRFHRTFDLVARWIDPRIPVYKIGIAEDWRRGVRVLYRARANS